jgi:hypothetical protein
LGACDQPDRHDHRFAQPGGEIDNRLKLVIDKSLEQSHLPTQRRITRQLFKRGFEVLIQMPPFPIRCLPQRSFFKKLPIVQFIQLSQHLMPSPGEEAVQVMGRDRAVPLPREACVPHCAKDAPFPGTIGR